MCWHASNIANNHNILEQLGAQEPNAHTYTCIHAQINTQLGRWISFARNIVPGATTAQQDWLEFNARNQITLWGPHGEINDYAKKEWGGLVRDYYKARWVVLGS